VGARRGVESWLPARFLRHQYPARLVAAYGVAPSSAASSLPKSAASSTASRGRSPEAGRPPPAANSRLPTESRARPSESSGRTIPCGLEVALLASVLR